MKEEDWVEIDRANGRFDGAWSELRSAYVKQIKRLEKQVKEANEVILKVKRLNEIMGVPEEITENYIKKYGVEK